MVLFRVSHYTKTSAFNKTNLMYKHTAPVKITHHLFLLFPCKERVCKLALVILHHVGVYLMQMCVNNEKIYGWLWHKFVAILPTNGVTIRQTSEEV